MCVRGGGGGGWFVFQCLKERGQPEDKRINMLCPSSLPIEPYLPTALLNDSMNSGLSVCSMLFLRID